MRCIISIAITICLIALNAENVASLTGPNVCSYSVPRTTSHVATVAYVGYESYRTCCKHFLFCWDFCYKNRRVTRYKYETRYSKTYVTFYRCCSGWAQSSYGCQTAICNSPQCLHGTCTRPDTCRCNAGYESPHTGCNRDVDECSASNGGCDQQCTNYPGGYSCACRRGFSLVQNSRCEDVNECTISNQICRCNDAANNPSCTARCLNTIGSYRCQCSSGYQLVGSTRCADINECLHNKGGCQHVCSNTHGSYQCSCRIGYQLQSDGKNCSDVNECSAFNGGCEQSCANTVGSFSCRCRPGYLLDYNGRTCSDINECSLHPHYCQHVCNNFKGSFFCSCNGGYRLNADNRTCSDVNECNELQPGTNITLSKCTQKCHNMLGSYFCSCNIGYDLAPDGKTCNDINECRRGTDGCQQSCINIIGSYVCRCLPGYRLNADGRRCDAMPCLRHPPVINGRGSCFFGRTDDVCRFNCSRGFVLRGSSVRQCQANHTWSGSMPTCARRHCDKLDGPGNGSVTLPCFTYYQTQCEIRCNNGYYAKGPNKRSCRTSANGTMYWSNAATSCQEVTVCTSNPCKHGGKCKVLTKAKYSCLCSRTGYIGERCEEGIVVQPTFPILTAGHTYTFKLYAKPATNLLITLNVNDASFHVSPKTLVFNGSVTSAVFQLTPDSHGVNLINYILGGADATNFRPLEKQVLYVQSESATYDVDNIIRSDGALSRGCFENELVTSEGNNMDLHLKLHSTAPWRGKFDEKSTDGVLLIDIEGTELPASLVGLSIKSKDLINNKVSDFILKQKNQSSLARIEDKATGCVSEAPSTKYLPEVVEVNAFSKTVSDGFNQNTPSFTSLVPEGKVTTFDQQDFEAKVLPGNVTRVLYAKCGEIVKSLNDMHQYYVFSTKQRMLLRMSEEDFDFGPQTQICVMKSVGQNKTLIGFNNALKKSKFWESSTGWSVKINGFHYEKKGSLFSYGVFGEFSTVVRSKEKVAEILLAGYMEFYAENDIEFSKDGILATKSMFGRGKISMKISNNVISEKSTFVGQGTINMTTQGNTSSIRNLVVSLGESEGGSSRSLINGSVQLDQDSNLTYRFTVKESGGAVRASQNGTLINNICKHTRRMISSLKSGIRTAALKHPSLQASATAIVNDLMIAETAIINVSRFTNESKGQLALSFLFDLKKRIDLVERKLQVFSIRHRQLNTSEADMQYMSEFETSSDKLKQTWRTPLKRSEISRLILTHSVAVKGSICFHRLCFQYLQLEIFCNSSSSVLEEQFGFRRLIGGSTVTVGKVKSDVVLCGLVTIPKHGVVVTMISNGAVKEAFFNSTLKIYDSLYSVEVKYAKGRLEFSTSISLPDGSLSKISGLADIRGVINKDEIVFTIKGTAKNGTTMVSKLNGYLHAKMDNVSKKVAERMDTIERAVTVAKMQLNATKEHLENAKDAYWRKVDQYLTVENNLNQTKQEFLQLRLRLLSEIEKYNSVIINYTAAINQCPPKVCTPNCVPGLVAKICFEEMYTEVLSQFCSLAEKKFTEEEVRSISSKKQFKTHRAESKCETKCPPLTQFMKNIFGKRRRRELSKELLQYEKGLIRRRKAIVTLILKKVLEKVLKKGTTELFGYLGGKEGKLGAQIGSYLPGPFGIVGMIVGGVIGSAFGTCDKHCKMVLVPTLRDYIEQKLVKEYKTIRYNKSVCIDVPKRQKLGYTSGHACLRRSNCSEELANVECLRHNQRCYAIRSMLEEKVRNISSIGPVYNEYIRRSLKQEELEVRWKRANLEQSNAYQTLLAAQAIVSKANYSYSLAVQALANANKFLSNEIKISTLVKSMGKDALQFEQVQYSYSISRGARSPNVIYLSAEVQRKDGRKYQVGFLYDFENSDLSAVDGVRQVFRALVSDKITRRRKAIREKISGTQSEEISVDEISKNATAEKCKEIDRSVLYLINVLEVYLKGISQWNDTQMLIGDARAAQSNYTSFIKGLVANSTICDGESGSSVCSREWLTALYTNETKASNNDSYEKMTWASKRAEIFANVERLTESNNMTDCSGTIDCVKYTTQNVVEYIQHDSSGLSQKAMNHMLGWEKTFSQIFEDFGLDENSTCALVKGIIESFKSSKVTSIYCGTPPVISKDLPSVLDITSDTIPVISISTEPSLHDVNFKWAKDGKEMKVAPKSSLTFNEATIKTASGFYHCEVSNKFGKTISSVVNVVLREAPEITVHPKGQTTTVKSPKAAIILTCNATGQPHPEFSWTFSPFTNTSLSIGLPGNEALLQMNATNSSQSGFYFCHASNSQGSVASKAARVHVRDSKIAVTSVEVSFVAALQVDSSYQATISNLSLSQNASANTSANASLPPHLSEKEKLDVEQALSQQMNISTSRVSNLVYMRSAQDRSVISFEIKTQELDSMLAANQDWTDMSDELVMARKGLLVLPLWLQYVYSNVSTSIALAGVNATVLPDSMQSILKDPQCATGYSLNQNGFICESCSAGTLYVPRNGCEECPKAAYQPEPKKLRCISCKANFTTTSQGSVLPSDCIPTATTTPRAATTTPRAATTTPRAATTARGERTAGTTKLATKKTAKKATATEVTSPSSKSTLADFDKPQVAKATSGSMVIKIVAPVTVFFVIIIFVGTLFVITRQKKREMKKADVIALGDVENEERRVLQFYNSIYDPTA